MGLPWAPKGKRLALAVSGETLSIFHGKALLQHFHGNRGTNLIYLQLYLTHKSRKVNFVELKLLCMSAKSLRDVFRQCTRLTISVCREITQFSESRLSERQFISGIRVHATL